MASRSHYNEELSDGSKGNAINFCPCVFLTSKTDEVRVGQRFFFAKISETS